MSPRKGEVYTDGGRRVVVVSSDVVSESLTWVASLVRRHPDDSIEADPLTVDTHAADPVTGMVVLIDLLPVSAHHLTDPVGTLIGATMDRINDGLRFMFDV